MKNTTLIIPKTEVQVWGFSGQLVGVNLVTLTVWESALRLELKVPESGNVRSIVRKVLGCPKNHPLNALSAHITESLRSIQEQLGI